MNDDPTSCGDTTCSRGWYMEALEAELHAYRHQPLSQPEVADTVDQLRRTVEQLEQAADALDRVVGERDLARDAAVALEQELAQVQAILTTVTVIATAWGHDEDCPVILAPAVDLECWCTRGEILDAAEGGSGGHRFH